MNYKSLFLLFVVYISFNSCCKKETKISYCDIPNPLENITWLRLLIEDFEKDSILGQQITHYIYNNSDVFKIVDRPKGADSPTAVVYDCSKTIICQYGGRGQVIDQCHAIDFDKEASDEEVIYWD